MDKQVLNEYKELQLQNYIQNYTGMYFHPEGGGDFFINEGLTKIKTDLHALDTLLVDTGTAINDLLINTSLRLEEVKKSIISEKERYQDMMMLCNRYTDFESVKALDVTKFSGSYNQTKDGVIYAPCTQMNKVNVRCVDVQGNGYEGNAYVYDKSTSKYHKDICNTADRGQMTDDSSSTYYEYSRLVVDEVEENAPRMIFNKDNEHALCTIYFYTEDIVNYIDISSEDSDISITAIQYSADGIDFKLLETPEIKINNILESYGQYGYIYGSGKIAVPMAQHFKITFQANNFKTDTIAYEKTIFENDENVSVNSIPYLNTSTQIVPSAKRSVIKINDIKAYKNIYSPKASIVSPELITAHAYSIALFCNVYTPYPLDETSVKFKMNINGQEYEIVPINSDLNGTKVIRFSGGKSSTSYTELITEPIKTAKLTIQFDCKSSATPYLNNFKILIGGEI